MVVFPKRGRRGVVSLIALFMGAASGLLFGIGGYTFIYARGASYLGNEPETCANCHVMQDHLAAWAKSSHKHVAVCNDCHTPHNFFGKYYVKAANGFHHSLAFTTGRFPDNIRIRPSNHAVTEGACRYCHSNIVQEIDRFGHGPQALECVRCHDTVGHLK
ncbi:MAG: cytochrome c nitrite reductase small subunit [Candidatus Hydrogenedentes bacterium]|jgi:cytochrome c nitrite reductase small subunit|nr:cytochrome c nitrite reductase small subunit [Candidatus Hydrogenedentota bacterium]